MAGFISIIWLLDQFALYGKQDENLKTILYLYNQNQTKIEWITDKDCANEFKGMLTMSSFARTEKNPFTKIMKEDLVKPAFSVYNFMNILENPIKYLNDVNENDLQIINNIIQLDNSISINVIEIIKHIFPLRNNNNNYNNPKHNKYLLKSIIHKDANTINNPNINIYINKNKQMKSNSLSDSDSDDLPLLLSDNKNNLKESSSSNESDSEEEEEEDVVAVIRGNKKNVKKLLSTLSNSTLINSYQQIDYTQQFLANIVSKTKSHTRSVI
jgi:hypothetical protein